MRSSVDPRLQFESLRRLHRVAVLDSARQRRVVADVTEQDLSRLTPCGPRQVFELLRPTTTQHVGFAQAVRGVATSATDWHVPTEFAHPVESHQRSVDEVLAAFSEADFLNRRIVLPESAFHPLVVHSIRLWCIP